MVDDTLVSFIQFVIHALSFLLCHSSNIQIKAMVQNQKPLCYILNFIHAKLQQLLIQMSLPSPVLNCIKK